MNQKLSIAQLKSISRGQLLGKYGITIGATVSANAIIMAASMLCSLLIDQETLSGQVIAFLITFILDLLSGIFMLGLTRFFLHLACDRPYRLTDIFYGFRSHTDKALAVRFFILTMQLLVLFPCLLCSVFYRVKGTSTLFLLSCITIVIGGILYTYITLLYSQVYYIMLDFPGYSTRQIMSTSRRIMKGNKARLFYMGVTLIPYYLLGFLSCGVAMFWVAPYTKVVCTNFYLDLMHREYTV